MDQPLDALARDVAELRAAWSGALPAFGMMDGPAQVEVAQMSDAGLVRVTDALARVRRDAEALLARVAAEVSTRSSAERPEGNLARAQGFHNPVRLIAASTGASRGEAAKLIAVGTATAERQTFDGARLPSRHPHVAAALASALIGIDAASTITSMLERVRVRADPGLADAAEAALVDLAARVPLDLLTRGVREAEARLDRDGVEPREEQLRDERSLTMREDSSGMVHLHARLDPETAAPIKAAIEAIVSDALRRREPASGPGPVVEDHRSIPQVQADALAAIARHALGCEQTLAPLAKATVVVRLDYDTLVEGLGHARIDGIDQPISATTARRLSADAELIPTVMGGDGVPLDLGRSARLFTRAQRIALAERDGGCASCGQNIAYVDAHHIRWWERDIGPTDLSNGVMLCSFCHQRIHRDGWEVCATRSEVWFTPPPHVDPAQTPRLGGRARFALPAFQPAA
ncbi:5-methylcytosine-specific restriction protein A [Agromyces flavus]|uniref:5-methylcytosine-specific restriction protein A n=1 Tax=Agromyces flavus TaxID=589382 RepID=A0A1H2A0A8_9MICO|nr:HNH endonuclease signature motif containing protein [Agromyces flavus]MCP2367365.1 5-methylcytosine-specific restriction protein A [Agromyces flavus]GGI45872.1 HNH endonuclease [Agromyces flavus]SDT39363.1 HNH endonuclease [Agromyces flavus]